MSGDAGSNSKTITALLRSFKKETRRKQIDKKFQSTRNEVIKRKDQEIFLNEKQQCLQHINQLFIRFQDANNQEKNLTILWDYCSQNNRYKYLTELMINKLLEILQHIRKQAEQSLQKIKQESKVMFLIANWTAFQSSIDTAFLTPFVRECIKILEENLSDELNILTLRCLANLCEYNHAKKQLLGCQFIKIVLACDINLLKWSVDVSLLFSNLVDSLPYNTQISQSNVSHLIEFIKVGSTKCESLSEDYFRQDILLIISKLLYLNGGAYHQRVIQGSHNCIQLYIKRLDCQKDQATILDTFIMLKHLYSNTSENSLLYSDATIWFVWKKCQAFLTTVLSDQYESQIHKEIWKVLKFICSFPHRLVVKQILEEIFDDCTWNNQHSENAIMIIADYYEGSEILQFCTSKLKDYYENEEICLCLLKKLHKYLLTMKDPEHFIEHRLKQYLLKIELNETNKNDQTLEVVAKINLFIEPKSVQNDNADLTDFENQQQTDHQSEGQKYYSLSSNQKEKNQSSSKKSQQNPIKVNEKHE